MEGLKAMVPPEVTVLMQERSEPGPESLRLVTHGTLAASGAANIVASSAQRFKKPSR
jgi:hypothetical protein